VGTAADVTGHYTRGDLLRAILDGLAVTGADQAELDSDDLSPVDEFHIGGRQATVELVDQLDLRPGLRVLDVGCGLGGVSRYLARRFGVRVVGVDLTPEFVEVARELTPAAGSTGSWRCSRQAAPICHFRRAHSTRCACCMSA